LRNAIRAIEALPTKTAEITASLTRSNAQQLPLRDSFADLVVTSPPYLGMIDYSRANRLTYLWMGWPLRVDMETEIGARYRRDRKDTRDQYLAALGVAAAEIARCLKPSRYCALIIGASRKYPDVAAEAIDLFAQSLRIVWGPASRVATRRRLAERRGRDPFELVCVLQREW
jgi:hypothetical protein